MSNDHNEKWEKKNSRKNQERIRTLLEKENYKRFKIMDADTNKEAEMKEKIRNEDLIKIIKFLDTAEISSKG